MFVVLSTGTTSGLGPASTGVSLTTGGLPVTVVPPVTFTVFVVVITGTLIFVVAVGVVVFTAGVFAYSG